MKSPRPSLPFPAAALVVFLFALGQLGSAYLDSSVEGYIVEVWADKSFRLDNGQQVEGTSAAAITHQGRAYSRPLQVGLKVNVSGRLDPVTRILRAERIVVLTISEKEVEGTAVVEEQGQTPAGIVLRADGRELQIQEGLAYVSPDEPGFVGRIEDIRPGDYVHYRGLWTETGVIEVKKLSAWRNGLEEKEQEIYEEYWPEMLMPPEPGVDLAVLKVGDNYYPVLDDPQLQLYVDRLGMKLVPELWKRAERTDDYGYSFWFLVVRHEQPQASAFPSGVVVIHSALLHLAENEAQLAFAIAHEIAHVIQEHSWREYLYHRKKLLFLRWGTVGIGYVVESAIRRGYQRDLEDQADRLAVWYMVRSGYDPREGLRFLDRLEESRPGPIGVLWDTHRSYGHRRRNLMDVLVRYSARGLDYGSLTRDHAEFRLLRARIPTAEVNTIE